MNTKLRKKSISRIVTAMICIIAFFAILVARLVYLQIFDAAELSEKQKSYMTKKLTLTATRGDICLLYTSIPERTSRPEASLKSQ